MNLTPHIVVTDVPTPLQPGTRMCSEPRSAVAPLPGGGVMTAELAIGDSSLHLASEFADAGILSPLTIGGTATVLQIHTDNADTLCARALGAGAEVRRELADQFWGERHGQVVDPFGHRWNIAERVRDVVPEELAAGAAKAFGSG
jgi:PhnB protein